MIPLFKVFMSPDREGLLSHIEETLYSGKVAQGPRVDELEQIISSWIGNSIITLNSGTSAIALALKLYDIKPRDNIITPALTCFATTCGALYHNTNIIWCDTDTSTMNPSIDDIVNKSNKDTKAIIILHWGGIPFDMEQLEDRLNKKGLSIPIIQDCAHAFGSVYQGNKIGSRKNDICAFSFQAIKSFSTVDGGMLIVPEDKYIRGRRLRWFGLNRDNPKNVDFRIGDDVAEAGYKYNMNDLIATIGIENMKYIDEILQQQRDNAAYYNSELQNIKEITFFESKENDIPSYWLYTIKVEKRDEFISYMKDNGIQVSRVHERNDKYSCMNTSSCSLPGVDFLTDHIVCLPVGYWIKEQERESIVKLIRNFYHV